MTTEDEIVAAAPIAEAIHTPILVAEIVELLAVRSGGRYIDATANGGGHTRALLAASAPDGRVLALDRDADLITRLAAALADDVATGRLVAEHASFADLLAVATDREFAAADGILFDLGLSSYHLDRSGRGFSFAGCEPLDMRFDADDATATARDLLADASAQELTDILRNLGEERFASRIARSIVATRERHPLLTTTDLFTIIERSLPANTRWRAARHAARVFQGLRIAVNAELTAIGLALPQAWECLAPGGRMAVLSFHSLEDRIVKRCFRDYAQAGRGRLLVKRPVVAGDEEREHNSRAASAKLRAIEKF